MNIFITSSNVGLSSGANECPKYIVTETSPLLALSTKSANSGVTRSVTPDIVIVVVVGVGEGLVVEVVGLGIVVGLLVGLVVGVVVGVVVAVGDGVDICVVGLGAVCVGVGVGPC